MLMSMMNFSNLFYLPSSCQIRRDYNGQRDFELYNESALIAAC